MNKYLRKTLKITLWIVASIILLVVLIAFSLNIPAVQNFVKDRAIAYLKNKTKTEVRLESIKIALPKDVVLNKFYIEDQKKDTLLYAEKLAVDISLFKLLKNTIEINSIKLQNISANVKRIAPDTTFNFSFLTKAFMSDEKKPEAKVEKDSTSTLKFSVENILLQDVGINYRDDVAGNDVKFKLGKLEAKIKTFDLPKQNYVLSNFDIKNTSLAYLQQKPLIQLVQHLTNSVDSAQLKQGKLPNITVEKFRFDNVKVDYDDQLTTTNAFANVNQLYFDNLKVDLTKGIYTTDNGKLANSEIKFAFKPAPSNNLKKVKDTVIPEKSSLTLAFKNILLENNHLKYDNLGVKPLKNGIDFNHLDITALNLGATNVNYNDSAITANVKNGSLKDKSGFILNTLSGDALYTSKQIKLANLILKTPNTSIENAPNLTFSSLNDLTKNPEKVKLNINLKNTTIGIKDALFFSDAIPKAYSNEKIKVNAKVNGYLNKLNIPQLQISGFKNTLIDISGKANNVTDINKAYLDVNIKRFYVTKSDLLAFIPKKTLPTNIELPNNINAVGNFKGGMTNFSTNLKISTDMGGATLIANMNGKKGAEKYKADINLQNFNVGRLLKQQPTLGKVTAKANVVGSALDPKKINARFNATVVSAYYNKYNYRNLKLTGNYTKQQVNVNGSMPDSNLNIEFTANANLANKYPAVKAQVNLTQVDLQKLNFATSELKFAGKINADIKTADVDYLNGDIFAANLQLVKDGKRFDVDTIQVNAKSTSTENALSIKSELLIANIEGKYQLSQVGNAIVNQINKYYQFGEVKKIPAQRLKFSAKIYNPKFLKDFVPELTAFAPSHINGLIDTQTDSLILHAVMPKITYSEFNLDSIKLDVGNKANQLNYKFLINSIQHPSISLFNTEISGAAINNLLEVNVFLRDRKRKDKYVLSGIFKSINKDFRFNLDPNKLLLDYEKWAISPDNYIQFGKSGILANQFNISQGNQLLSINSANQQPNSPLNVVFKNFEIETLMKFAETDTTIIGGEINGTANVKDLVSSPKFEADLIVNKLRYQKDQLGTLKALVNNNTENAFNLDVSLSGVHELSAKGFYYTAPQSALDLNVAIQKIDLSKIESLSMGQIKEGKGYLNGQFSVKGQPTKPQIVGGLKFNDAGFRATYVNSYFNVPTQEIAFKNDAITFNNFALIDSLGKKATINGSVNINDFSNVGFNLDIRTNNFRAMNSTANDNDMIYGTVYLSSNIQVRGDMAQPNVNMRVTVEEGTKFFYAMPVNDPAVIDQEGIVQFIDADAPPFNGEKPLKTDSIIKSKLGGMNLVANINITPQAELNVVVDPANGDVLKVKGEADLNAAIDPSGKITLTGRYEINEGSYAISVIPLGKKPFKLVKGSTIIWTGEPTEANVNLSALYEVNAAPIDLLNDPNLTTAKTKLPFQVYLYMKGELMKPIISFKIDLPENEKNSSDVATLAYNKLQIINRDESELNKQVFALLALNRFVANNPFQSLVGGGGGLNSMARSSVSKLLTEQLNNLAADLIEGVDIDFGLNSAEDYSTGKLQQKTDLEIGLSKKLLNDRLTVTVGSSFALEGPQADSKNAANIAGNVNIEYALSKDGKYRLRAYRRNQNESVVEGQIIETGVGFTLVVDYNKFREIFQRRKNRNRDNVEQRQRNEKIN